MADSVNQIVTALNASEAGILKLISEIPADKFNLKESETSWSAGEVLEHLCILDELIFSLFQGQLEACTRPVDEKTELIKTTFLNFEKKLNAPSALAPSLSDKNQNQLVSRYKEVRKKIKLAAETDDLSFICLSFEHRFFGKLTKYEWVQFIIVHALRHSRQIENIRSTY